MKLLINISTILIFSIGVFSCDRIKSKTEHISNKVQEKTKEELKKQVHKVASKIFPPFNHDKPDTENNKNRFRDFIKVEITQDIKNIYCYDEPIGINTSYMFSFNCNETTSNKIIDTLNLIPDTLKLGNALGMQRDFEWWDKERIKKLKLYSWKGEYQYFKFYWYDKENEKAYFFDFDI